jgi:hypothetical protein
MEKEDTLTRIDYQPTYVYKTDNKLYGQVIGAGYSVSVGGSNVCFQIDQSIIPFDTKLVNRLKIFFFLKN